MHVRHSFFYSTCEIHVKVAVHIRRKAGLHTDFGRSHIRCFSRPTDDFLDRQEIALDVPVWPAERAESPMLHADIREIDIAIDAVCNDGARLTTPQPLRRE